MAFTNRQFLAFHDECSRMRESILGKFFNGKITKFYDDNGIKLNTLSKKIEALKAEFFEMDGEGDNKRVRFTTPAPLPAVLAKYEKRVLSPKTFFKKEISEQVMVAPAVPEQAQQPMPVMKPDLTKEMFDRAYNLLLDSEVQIKF